MSSLKRILQIPSDLESIALKRTRLYRHFVFFTDQISKKTLLSQNLLLELFTTKKTPKLAVLCFLSQNEPVKKNWNGKTVSESKKLLPVCLSTNFFTTRQFLNAKFYNVSVVESTFLQSIRFRSRIVLL